MNLTLHLDPETEAKLKEHSRLTGRSLEDLAIEALQDRLSSDASISQLLSLDAWLEQFDAWIERHPSRNPRVDDSRDAIYSGRT